MPPVPESPEETSVSRRNMLTKSAAVAAAGAVALSAQTRNSGANQSAGRKFRALVQHGSSVAVDELTMLPLQPTQVAVCTQASAVCYTIVGGLLSGRSFPGARPSIPNHSGMGVVEEVGSGVKRVQVGDRVIVPGTPQCGQCYACITGRADWCQFLATRPAHPVAKMSDGTEIYESGALGGLSELMIVDEVYTCPVFTDVPSEQLCMLGDTLGTGLAAGHNLAPIEPGSDVVILGAGPVGMGAIQAARILGAAQVIVIEPIKYRRDLAMKVGATMVIDPNADPKGLPEKIRELCKGPTDRRYAGGRAWGDDLFAVPRGPDFTIEAVGGDAFPPKVEAGPDPTGILPLQWAFDFTRGGGHITTLGFGQKGDVSFPAMNFANRGRTFHAGQQGGLHMLRDLPRYVKLIEKGTLDAKSMVTATYPLDRAMEAVQAVADRTQLGAMVTFA